MAKKIEGLESVMNDLAKEYKTDLDIEFLDTGSIILNMVMGGGLPLQKFIEIYSASGYGKSTIVLSICKYLCKQGHKVVYIDAEASIDSLIGKDCLKIATDDENNLLWSPENPEGPFMLFRENTFENVEKILDKVFSAYKDENGKPTDSDIKLVVIDSIAALVPAGYYDDKNGISIGDQRMGLSAKYTTAFVKKYTGFKTAYNCSFIFINQQRDDLSMGFVPKDVVTGGRALEYFGDIRIKLTSRAQRKEKIQTGAGEYQEVTTEREVGVTAIKNKITNGMITLPLQVVFGKGISNIAALPYILPSKYITNKDGKEVAMLEQSGAWFTLNLPDQSIRCNGQGQLKEAIRDNRAVIFSLLTEDDFKVLKTGLDFDE